jgi:rSAM/selenodomain-associated transferase 1
VVGVAQAPAVAVLARAPSAGGKRRLFAALGRPVDPVLVRTLLLDTIDAVRASGLSLFVGVEPEEAVDEMRQLVPGAVVLPQVAGDIGQRMRALMSDVRARGASAVVLVGSDLPDLAPDVLRRAAGLVLEHPDALVLGPAADGGYYLIGACRDHDVFAGIEWGTSRVLAQTVDAAQGAGVACHMVDVACDVDRPEDLWSVRAARTRAWVDANLSRRAGDRTLA